MQVELVRDLINTALEEPDEKTRIGCFWVYAIDYDEYTPIMKKIFDDPKLNELKSEWFDIKRVGNDFLIHDKYGNVDLFTHDEIKLFIYLWEESFIVEANTITFVDCEENGFKRVK